MMVRICLLLEVEVSHSVIKSMAILSNGHSRITYIVPTWQPYFLTIADFNQFLSLFHLLH